MRHRFHSHLMVLACAAASLGAQGWDAVQRARGWAFQEVDGSLVFFDPGSQSLHTWMKGTGLLSSLPLSLPEDRKPAPAAKAAPAPAARGASDYDTAGALLYGIPRQQQAQAAPPGQAPRATPAAGAPERWVMDSYSRTWMTCEGQLIVLDKNGKLDAALPLAAAVEDLAVGRDGLLLLYRTLRPYLEKRDLRTGALLWSYGDRDQLKEVAAQPLLVPMNRMALGADGTIFIAEGAALALTVLDGTKGPKDPGQAFFTCQDQIPPRASLGRLGRGPLLSWAGKDVIFGTFTPSQVKACGAPASKGLILARFDLAKGSLEWLPTPLAEGHRLVGLLDGEAVFIAPEGGLAFAAIH